MIVKKEIFVIVILSITLTHIGAQSPLKEVKREIEALNNNSKNKISYQHLHTLITDHYTSFTKDERKEIRARLKESAPDGSAIICSANERGTKIKIKGTVTDQSSTPIQNVNLYIFQTDAMGYYTPYDSINKSMGENDPRLFAFLKTDAAGNFEFTTVRPASYPTKYKDSYVPQHIHINTSTQGFKDRLIQVVFEDDPAMNAKWVEWAKNLDFPVLKLEYNKAPPSGVLKIILSK